MTSPSLWSRNSKYRHMLPSKIREMGASLSRTICKRLKCGKRVTMLAKHFGDPYCSRVCLEKDTGKRRERNVAQDYLVGSFVAGRR